MTIEVQPDELRDAAKELERASLPLACLYLPTTRATGEKVGHVELAGWAASLLDYCAGVSDELSRAASSRAERLRTTADDLERQDEWVGGVFGPDLWLPAPGTGAGGGTTPAGGPGSGP